MQTIKKLDDIPVSDSERRRTDICCTILAALFSLFLFVYALIGLNTGNLAKTNFPTDSDGGLCSYDYPGYPYVYFVDLNDITRRVCVSQCPTGSETALKCRATKSVGCRASSKRGRIVSIYETDPTETRTGNYCFPSDPDLSRQIQTDVGIWDKQEFINSWETIRFGLYIAAALGLVYMLLTQFLPKIMNYAAIFLGALAMLILGILTFTYNGEQFAEYKGMTVVVGIALIVIALLMLVGLYLYRNQLRINAVFLSYAAKMIASRPAVLLYILVFCVFLFGLFVLSVFEFLAFWSTVSPVFDNKNIYWKSEGFGPTFLSILLFIQLYWGLSFLKEAFNFCISGNAVNFYFASRTMGLMQCFTPFWRILKYHFGSIVGGSFMTGFFTVPDFIFDLIKPSAGSTGCWSKFYGFCFGWLNAVFDLVRSDAMAYINIASLPYCNSARYCEFLCDNTTVFEGSQSVSRIYRFSAHFFLVACIGYLGLYYKENMAIFAQVFLMGMALFIVTFFISIHADAAEGLSITFLADEYLQEGDYTQVKGAPEGLVEDLTVAIKAGQGAQASQAAAAVPSP